MNTSTSSGLDAAFGALSDPTRRAIVTRLIAGEASVTELMRPFDLSQPTVSKHLKVLEEAGIIEVVKEAQKRPRRLRPEALQLIDDWLAPLRKTWVSRLDNLERHLATRKEV